MGLFYYETNNLLQTKLKGFLVNNGTLRVDKVSKAYKQGGKVLPVLNNISTAFEQGKSYAITGASGSGKSTLLYLLGGLEKPSSGRVLCNKQDLAALKDASTFRNKTIGFVFQFHYLINELTVLENIMLMGKIARRDELHCRAEAYALLDVVGLRQRASYYPHQLSGGEQQRVSIARSLFNKPKFLLADEPTGSLDAHNAAKIVELLERAQQEWGMGVILCSHDIGVYSKMNQILTLHEGQLSSVE